ncbi:hypothetical protein K1Y80_32635, partial [Streptomyces sp. MAG02]|nr:hypothetical protein [Streptomyces sp. MAG02]
MNEMAIALSLAPVPIQRFQNAKKPRTVTVIPYGLVRGFPQKLFGGVLLSHRVPPAVPSALK